MNRRGIVFLGTICAGALALPPIIEPTAQSGTIRIEDRGSTR